jgi:lupus La protein
MSNLKAETMEPDPAATSLPDDDTVNKGDGDPSAPTDKEAVMAAAESEDVNGASEAKEEKTAEKSEAATDVSEEISDTKAEDSGVSSKKEDKIDNTGVLKTKAQIDETRKNHSKYDPSILPTTNDPKKIRAQVCSNVVLLLYSATNNV